MPVCGGGVGGSVMLLLDQKEVREGKGMHGYKLNRATHYLVPISVISRAVVVVIGAFNCSRYLRSYCRNKCVERHLHRIHPQTSINIKALSLSLARARSTTLGVHRSSSLAAAMQSTEARGLRAHLLLQVLHRIPVGLMHCPTHPTLWPLYQTFLLQPQGPNQCTCLGGTT